MSDPNTLELACAQLTLTHRNQKIPLSELSTNLGKWFNSSLVESLKKHSLVEVEQDRLYLSSQGESLAKLSLEKKSLGERLGQTWFGFSGEALQDFGNLIQKKIDTRGLETLRNYFSHSTSANTQPLSELAPGQWHPVWMVPVDDFGVLEQLRQFQIIPGKLVKVFQKLPLFVIETESTKLVIDSGLASKILVSLPKH
jgi:Fe2+ transport system protein FeoA